MKPSLFRPRQFTTPPSLVLVPYFAEATLYAHLKKQASRGQDFLHSSLLWFENMAIVSGFIGYPHLLTLLGLIADLPAKEVYFLGTAGAVNPRLREPLALQVGEIRPSAIFKRFSHARALRMKKFSDPSFPVASGASVDIIQRETPSWLAAQRSLRTDFVEMELFPLRWFLGRPFHAMVALSDRVEATGIRPFAEKETFKREFNRAFHAITRYINHG
jgi:hypothetical protein